MYKPIDYNSYRGKNIKVALIDSGVDVENKSIKRNILPGCMFYINMESRTLEISDDFSDVCKHGTCCAEEITAIAPDCKIIPIRIFDNELNTNSLVLAEAICHAAEQGADIINISAGSGNEKNSKLLRVACSEAVKKGILVIASENNNKKMTYPACFKLTIGVRGIDYGANIPFYELTRDNRINVFANGRRNLLRSEIKDFTSFGSSFATAHITGIAAVIMEQYGVKSLKDILRIMGKDKKDKGIENRV